MKHLISLVVIAAIAAPAPALAVDEDDCAIWLCLPAGFPSGCGGAKSKFKDRIKHLRPPLPNFASCLISSGPSDSSSMSADFGVAALIREQQVCKEWKYQNYNGGSNGYGTTSVCVEWVTVPEHMIKGTPCNYNYMNTGSSTPQGCYKTINYVDIYQESKQLGDTYTY